MQNSILDRLLNNELFIGLSDESVSDEDKKEIDSDESVSDEDKKEIDIDVDLLASKIDLEQKKEEKDIEVPKEIYENVDYIFRQGIGEKDIRKLSITDNVQNFMGFFSWKNLDYSGLFLHDIHLNEQYRKRGVGRKIINTLIKVLTPIYVYAHVVTESRGFFDQLGWSHRNDPYMHYSSVAEAKAYNESNNGFELCVFSSSGNKYYALDLDCDYKIKAPFKLIIDRIDECSFSLLYDGNNLYDDNNFYNINRELKRLFDGHNMSNFSKGFCVIYDLKDLVKAYISHNLQAERQKEETAPSLSHETDSLQIHITPAFLSYNKRSRDNIESSDFKVAKKVCR